MPAAEGSYSFAQQRGAPTLEKKPQRGAHALRPSGLQCAGFIGPKMQASMQSIEQDRIRRARAWRIRSVGLNRWVQRASGGTWELNASAGAARCAAWRAWVVRVACRCAEGDARTMA